MNFFVIYIGGAHEKSFIELHDMRFIIAEKIEDTYEEIRKSWWGAPETLHIDAFGALRYADGYEIHIKNTPPLNTEQKLYFVNLGGYDNNEFTELHKNVFVVAENDSRAKVKALKQILDWQSHHRDYQFEVDKVWSVDSILSDQQHFIHLRESSRSIPFEFVCKYIAIKNQ
jgi:hypothetical protein